ncbi:DUF485 domain-containing protein [Pseudomaricurvus alkylphenolicus]|uniref:DUF485 domain-containing protein n=1 Tax=Pseudomaricurvus alkylphenolicus TaxID=1306991 RepID=UPI001423679B|nr:DUF485 domain-containing protein [Pseudomaricurvus alkylphenolicus]NIB43496.1 DUF485 domain-containing protein [Pseudomaricurvus alkylphenolicus]
MTSNLIERLQNDPDFHVLSRERHKSRVFMAGAMILVLAFYLICWAYFPALINARIPAQSSVSLGVWFTVAVVLISIGLSGYYTLVVGRRHDQLNQKLLGEERP